MFDVIIIGGSNAGLSAALVLGRSRRRVLLIDDRQPRNQPSAAVHSFFTRDGTPPHELIAIGIEQLRPYTTVQLRQARAIDAQIVPDGFEIMLHDGKCYVARKLLFATGVRDILPPIDGVADLWGRGVFHCPYCHGWEVRDQPLAVYGNGTIGLEFALFVRGWSDDVVLCTGGPAAISAEECQRLARNNIAVREERIERVEGHDGVLDRIVFATGESLDRQALFLRTQQQQRCDLPIKLGCELVGSEPFPALLRVDQMGHSTVPGVYVAGDAATFIQQAIMAAATGATAASAINRALLQEDFT